MNEQIPEVVVKKCGNCEFGHFIDLQARECRGVPPTPVLMPGPPNALGQPQMAVSMLRVRLPANEPGCALWKMKMPVFDLGALRTATKDS